MRIMGMQADLSQLFLSLSLFMCKNGGAFVPSDYAISQSRRLVLIRIEQIGDNINSLCETPT